MKLLRHPIKCVLVAAIASWVLAVPNLYAGPVPAFNLKSLIERSDLIVVGRIGEINIVGETTIPERGSEARIASAQVRVMTVLAGKPISNEIVVNYLFPWEMLGYGSLRANSTRLLFLRQTNSAYEFADRYYPSLPAVSGSPPTKDDSIGRVISQLSAVLISHDVTASDKDEALYALGTCKDSRAIQGLAQDLGDPSPAIRLEIMSQLALLGNIEGIKLATEALLTAQKTSPDYIFHNLRVGIREGARDERIIPELSALLQSKDESTREAAAEALFRMHSRNAMDPLVQALRDEDKQVRFFAVVGLAEITGDKEHHPSGITYHDNESYYLQYWRAWSSQH